MEGFDLPEALHQWSQMKSRLADEPFFRLSYKQFWEHVSCHYDSAYEFCEVLKPIRVSLMMLADTSCCERGLAEYGSIHDDERARLAVEKVREVMAVRHYGPPSIAAFDPRPMYRSFMGILSEDPQKAPKRRRNVRALIRGIMTEAQSK